MNILVVAATEMEMRPVRKKLEGDGRVSFLLCGVGPVETGVRLTKFLAREGRGFDRVVHCGVAGAYPDTGARPLDICLATKEFFGDLGISAGEAIHDFDSDEMALQREFVLDQALLEKAADVLGKNGMSPRSGRFVTVACASGTAGRGIYLRDKYQALCENMEGAAVARVCREFFLPCLEIRCVSNLVEDRNPQHWRLAEACQRGAEAAALLAASFASD